jgi:hypothetical protein
MRINLNKLKSKYTDGNLLDCIFSLFRELFNFLGLNIQAPIERRRAEVSNRLTRLHGNSILYGPLKGIALSNCSWWGATDRAAMIFGLYEIEVMQMLLNKPNSYNTFVDLGAADGYYAVGLLKAKYFTNAYAFEINAKGRDVVSQNAELNCVSQKLQVYGEATQTFYEILSKEERESAVILVDIEGAEFDLLSESVFKQLNKAIFIVELHDFFFADGCKKTQDLINRSSNTHRYTEVYMGSRNPSECKELNTLSDSDRWLICSEGRAQLMRWLRFDPLV